MITIPISEDTQGELIKIARQIQKEACDKTDFDTVIRFLIGSYLGKGDQKKTLSLRIVRHGEVGRPRGNQRQS